jgi:pyruvate dehydrogenase E1 component alpha subunit
MVEHDEQEREVRLYARMLELMNTVRAFEEKAEELYTLGKIHGTMHLSIGMEASAVGSVLALEAGDLVLSTHRGHGHCIAKGADLKLMMAEFMGKECGYCRGRGGSMHIADVDGGNLGANGVVAGGIPMAVGVGLGLKLQKRQDIIMNFFGDGATNEGAFHEALNMAAIYRLPVVYVCENNQYGMSFPVQKAVAIAHLSERAASYGMPGVTVDGNDLLAVYRAAREAVLRAHQGGGPTLIEAVTYRWRGHSKSDANRYRTKDEIEAWKARDPIQRFGAYLVEASLLSGDQVEAVRASAYAAIDEAVTFADGCAEPELSSIEEGVYA